MATQSLHTLYGSTNEQSSVPDAPFPEPYEADPLETMSKRLRGSDLADALMGWECYSDAPLAGAPLVLRFEHCDLEVSAQGDALRLATGCVDTASAQALQVDEAACPAWVPHGGLAPALGQKVTGIQRDTASALRINLETYRIAVTAEHGSVSATLQRTKTSCV